MNEQTKARIKELQKEKDVVILAHYYVDGEVQEIADYVPGFGPSGPIGPCSL